MPTTRCTSGGLRLPGTSFRSQAPAYAETARSLAGRATELYELATGASSAAGEQPVTRPNPQGLTGWDLSGPPWGSALLHPVVWFTGTQPVANLVQPAYDASNALWFSQGRAAQLRFSFWNRPFEGLAPFATAPLQRLYWALRTYRVSGATTPTATAITWNRGMGQSRETGVSQTFTTTANDSQVTSSTLWVAARPGWNTVYLEVRANASGTVHMLSAGCLQVLEKRSH